MSKVSSPKKDSKAVAKDFIAVTMRVMKSSSAPMVAFAEQYDLSFTQLKLMFALSNLDEPQPIGRLAELTGSTLPSMGRAVDGLVRHGLVTRTEDPLDRRVKRIEPTELGASSMYAIYETRVNTLSEILDQLPPEQVDALASALAPLNTETEVSG
ncbi:MAG: MarR family transcriptional regulator [Solirubrobacteraceae bacterium]|nr:MarR family transcriptional regulator [Solirubrobacteraceae bacterium]